MPGEKTRRGFVKKFALCLGLLAAAVARPAVAQVGSERYASMVIDAASGTVIEAANGDEYRYPASLTKMMTIYLLFEAIRDHRVSFSDPVPISAWAASMPPTKLGLIPGGSLTVEQALLGLVTKSANDAAAALGEMLGGDEERFAQMMTLRARALGMSHTTFRNASGLPDWGQVTTARDMVILARHLIQDFPTYYHYFSTPSFQFHGRTVLNHQRLLQTYAGTDGLKTGYTEASGYNVVTSAVRGDVRLIGVVLGAGSGGERDLHMEALLDQGFTHMGVPVEFARRESPGYRIPSFIGTASAATLRATPVQFAEARPARVRGRRSFEASPAVARGRKGARSARSYRTAATQRVPIIAIPVVPRAAAARSLATGSGWARVPASRLPATRTAHRWSATRGPG